MASPWSVKAEPSSLKTHPSLFEAHRVSGRGEGWVWMPSLKAFVSGTRRDRRMTRAESCIPHSVNPDAA